MLGGFLLLTETRVETVVKKDASNSGVSRSKLLRKLHLVEIQQSIVTSKKMGSEVKDKLEQIDSLSLGEETSKLIDFVEVPASQATNSRPTYFVFMINRERMKSSGFMKLISVKVKWARKDSKEQESSDESDFGKKKTDEMGKVRNQEAQEESKAAGDSKKKGSTSDLKLKFEYVSEVSPKITNFQGEK